MSTVDGAGYSPFRLLLIAGALVALVLGLTTGAALAPLAAALGAIVEIAGHDYAVAAMLGALAVLAGLVVFASGRGASMQQTEMPAVERPLPVPSAGEPFDETIAGWRFATRIFGGTTGDEVRERLRAAAVAAVAADEGCSRPDARRRVEAGTWTDDDVAAAFLAGEYTPLGTWLVALRRRETGPEYRARRTVAAIVDRRERHRDRAGRAPTTPGNDDRRAREEAAASPPNRKRTAGVSADE